MRSLRRPACPGAARTASTTRTSLRATMHPHDSDVARRIFSLAIRRPMQTFRYGRSLLNGRGFLGAATAHAAFRVTAPVHASATGVGTRVGVPGAHRSAQLVRSLGPTRADGPDLEVKGNIMEHEYTIEDGRTTVAKVSKKWFRVADTYGVEVAPGGTGGDLGRHGGSGHHGTPGTLIPDQGRPAVTEAMRRGSGRGAATAPGPAPGRVPHAAPLWLPPHILILRSGYRQ